MTLGKRIAQLRSQRGISQIELAEQLMVSRQAISKWETDGSVPELEKLIQLSNIFGVTLDELVKGEAQQPTSQPAPAPAPAAQPAPSAAKKAVPDTQKRVGAVLLCIGAALCLLLTIGGAFLGGLILASPFWLCGVVCLTSRRHTGLWCAWAVLLCVNLYLRYATSITWRLVMWTFPYDPAINYLRVIFAWLELLAFLGMMALTVYRLGKTPLVFSGKVKLWVFVAVVALVLLEIPLQLDPLSGFSGLIYITQDWFRLAVLTVLLTVLRRIFRWHKEQKQSE